MNTIVTDPNAVPAPGGTADIIKDSDQNNFMTDVIDASRDVLVIVDPDDTQHRHRHAVYGLLAETTPIANPTNRRFAKEFIIEELI